MRRFAPAMITLALVACSAGCSGGDGRDGDVETDPEARAKATAAGGDGVAAAQDSGSAGARQVALSTELYSFSYSYPGEAGKRQGLRMVLDRRLEEARTALIQQARESKKDSEAENYEFRPHTLATEWTVAARPPGWLSLVAETDSYFGGAHGMYTFDSLVWNDRERKGVKPVALFATPEALLEAIGQRFCARLDEQRAERRGKPVAKDSDDPFDACIDPIEDAVIVLRSQSGDAFDTIGILVPPYAAGPYAEGSYEVEIPVTRRVIAALKPGYRGAFALPGETGARD